MVIARNHGTKVEPTSKPSIPKKVGIVRLSLGFQIVTASPIRATMRPIVTTSCATNGASVRRRMSTRSTTAPSTGATPATVISTASRVGTPQSTLSVQYT